MAGAYLYIGRCAGHRDAAAGIDSGNPLPLQVLPADRHPPQLTLVVALSVVLPLARRPLPCATKDATKPGDACCTCCLWLNTCRLRPSVAFPRPIPGSRE